MFNNHPYHLVSYSPWPIMASLALFNLTFSAADWMSGYSILPLLAAALSILMIMFQWWRDITRESLLLGSHTKEVVYGLKMGMMLFIISEVFFFLSFFWAFFHSSLSPDINIGMSWPAPGIMSFSPMGIPMLNTVILLSSGVTITWSHHAFMIGDLKKSKISLLLTILLGVFFTIMQWFEYLSAPFTIADCIYGSTFFMTTGFHGIHVIIGSIIIITSLIRLIMNHFSSSHFICFLVAAWYWHFVDFVWLILYLSMYWWGG
uniref:Cytochrome c oxidase subunit 3 n=1 Tax=Aeolothrips indicus TaxID=2856552 RepID=A0A8F5J8D4_9NEOP|nr:cytochrome c oxidase subunit 3 [Aeolothrips indicus]